MISSPVFATWFGPLVNSLEIIFFFLKKKVMLCSGLFCSVENLFIERNNFVIWLQWVVLFCMRSIDCLHCPAVLFSFYQNILAVDIVFSAYII